MKFKLSIHPKSYSSKPTDAYTLQNGYRTKEIDFKELRDIISNGQTIVPSILNSEHRKNANFVGCQVFMLDFDDNQDPLKEIAKFKEYGINVNLTYNSFSNKKEFRKFRLVIVLDTIIEDPSLFKNVMNTLIKIGGSDGATKDLSRMFYAGTEPKVINGRVNIWNDVKGAIADLINKDKALNNHTRTIKKLNISQNDANLTSSYSNIDDVESASKQKTIDFNFDEACKNSKQFNGFDKGTIHLKYLQLRALISNMMFVRGGLKYVGLKMNERGDYNGDDYALLRRIPNAGYQHPESMSSFDSKISGSYTNVLSLDNKNRVVVTQIREIVKEPIDVVASKFKSHFENAFKSKNRVSIINAPTGTGKTKQMINVDNVILALPNHRLKDEIAERMDSENLPYVVTPAPPLFSSDSLNRRYNTLQSIGESKMANNLIDDVANGRSVSNIEYSFSDSQVASEFKSALAIAYESEVTVLTTHTRVMLAPQLFANKDTVIFDEDIMGELMFTSSITTAKVNRVIDNVLNLIGDGENSKVQSTKDFYYDMLNIQSEITDLVDGQIGTFKTQIRYKNRTNLFERLSQIEGTAGFIKLIKADYAVQILNWNSVSSYHFGNVRGFDECFSKVIVLSASADSYFYDRLLSKEDGYDFFHSGIASNVEPIKQDTTKSYSRSTLGKGDFPIVDSDIVLTYKAYSGSFKGKEQQEYYFGNTLGIDSFKGKDISVVGTPIAPSESTIIKAVLLNVTYASTEKSKQTVRTNHHEFTLFTFEDKNLAEIEVKIAEAEISQTIGRGRSTRTSSKIDLYSAIPMIETDKFIGKKFTVSNNLLPVIESTEYIEREGVLDWLDGVRAEDKKNREDGIEPFQYELFI